MTSRLKTELLQDLSFWKIGHTLFGNLRQGVALSPSPHFLITWKLWALAVSVMYVSLLSASAS